MLAVFEDLGRDELRKSGLTGDLPFSKRLKKHLVAGWVGHSRRRLKPSHVKIGCRIRRVEGGFTLKHILYQDGTF
jgi:hypothetical protein